MAPHHVCPGWLAAPKKCETCGQLAARLHLLISQGPTVMQISKFLRNGARILELELILICSTLAICSCRTRGTNSLSCGQLFRQLQRCREISTYAHGAT